MIDIYYITVYYKSIRYIIITILRRRVHSDCDEQVHWLFFIVHENLKKDLKKNFFDTNIIRNIKIAR